MPTAPRGDTAHHRAGDRETFRNTSTSCSAAIELCPHLKHSDCHYRCCCRDPFVTITSHASLLFPPTRLGVRLWCKSDARTLLCKRQRQELVSHDSKCLTTTGNRDRTMQLGRSYAAAHADDECANDAALQHEPDAAGQTACPPPSSPFKSGSSTWHGFARAVSLA